MALHQLSSITMGVPNVQDTCRYYAEFGLIRNGARFSTRDGGEQLHIIESQTRRLSEVCIGADDPDDVARVSEQLSRLGIREQSAIPAASAHSRSTVALGSWSRSFLGSHKNPE